MSALPGTLPALVMAGSLVFCAACGDEGLVASRDETLDIDCSIPVADVHRGATRGAIPALTNPPFAFWGDVGTEYLALDDRVVGLFVDDEPVAIPLNIFWWHEIVNLDATGGAIAVTHCPLTGSTLAFDRGAADGSAFEVSGLLYENNLMMADLAGGAESLWPQMARGARCGPKDGTPLLMIPVVEMTWRRWRTLHPDARVVTSMTGHAREYREYPYDDYDEPDNEATLFPVFGGIDDRRPPKERVLGIPEGEGGVVFPFGALDAAGATASVNGRTANGAYVVLWDREGQAAAAFRPSVDGQDLTFTTVAGRIFDEETGSEWRIDGVAIAGPLLGSSLAPISDAFVAYWFAWPVFYPRLQLWTGP